MHESRSSERKDMKYLLGIDVGTTNLKATLYNLEFQQIAECSEEYPTHYPQAGWAEQDCDDWWQAAVSAMRNITRSMNSTTDQIKGICVSSQAPAVLPLDADGRALRRALIWMDRRSEPQCSQILQTIGQPVFSQITGNRIDPYFALPKILWFKQEEPDLYDKTWKFLQVNGYINFRLTGKATCDRVHASLTGLYDRSSSSWSSEILSGLSIDLMRMPDIFDSTDVIGFVREEAARETGLSQGIPVIAGNVDASSAALEAGVIGQGDAAEMTGTSSCFMLGCDEWPDSINLVSIHHAVNGHDLLIGPISSTGACLKWYRDQFGACASDDRAAFNRNPYAYMDKMAEQCDSSGKLLFLPYMAGERAPLWNTHARGVLFGLNHSTTRNQIIRSILEGSGFALKHTVIEAEKSGQYVQSISSVGGGSNSRIWLQIKANILGIPVHTLQHSSSGAFGNALLAGYGVGLIDDIRDIVQQKIHVRETFYPQTDEVRRYQKLYTIFRNIYEHISPDFTDLASVE